MGRSRFLLTRFRWRLCVFGFAYYLCAVVVLENIIAIVYWNSSVVPDAAAAEPEPPSFRISEEPHNWSRFNESMSVSPGQPTGKTKPRLIVLEPQLGDNMKIVNDVPGNGGKYQSHGARSEANLTKPALKPGAVPSNKTATKLLPSTSRAPTIEEQERQYYRVGKTRVNPYLYNVTLRPRALCDNETFMIILVHSHHPYVERRAAIRNSWGSVAWNGSWPNLPHPIEEKIKLVFMLGTHKDVGLNDLIRDEWVRYDDIVQGNFYDSYQNMTLKSLLGLKLVSEHCPSAKYLFKNDDDMFINVPHLVHVLRNRTLSRAIMGPLNVGSKVYRGGKWKVSKQEFPFSHYPPYESGAAYLITCDIVRELFVTSEYVPSIFIDDVYITGILGRILNVTHERQQGFAYWTNKPPTACDVVENRIISGTKMTPKLLQSIWEDIKRGPPCGMSLNTLKKTGNLTSLK